MKYYLETNALRSMPKKYFNATSLKNCFTSGLSIIELISGLNDNEFEIRKKVIRNVFNSKIYIDWSLPDGIIGAAFPAISGTEYRIEDLRTICNIVIDSANFDIASSKIKDTTTYNLEYFSEFDTYISSNFITTTDKGNKEFSILFEQNSLNDLIFSPNDIVNNKRDLLNLLNSKYFNLNYSITIMSIARRYALEIEPNNKLKQEEIESDIYNSYNENIDIYVVAYSYYTLEKILNSNIPARNDFFDLQHLLYIRNYYDYRIVTNDKLLSKLGNMLSPPLCISIDDFIKQLNRNY